jgi:hypothetical protein
MRGMDEQDCLRETGVVHDALHPVGLQLRVHLLHVLPAGAVHDSRPGELGRLPRHA